MHWKDARRAGETEQRLYGLTAWREAPYYTPRERAALIWNIVAINAWNRLAIPTGDPIPGSYEPG
jgi:alkylhydroperoxidase family enzyme